MRVTLLLLAGLLAGCHHRLPKLNARGEHAEVVQRAESSRFRPRGKAARAYAASLHALGQDERALDALLLDYRRGGEVASLVALADLERTLGWRGLAAHHYGRVLTHDQDALSGRAEVCALFRDRAREYLQAGEGEAADLDMRRVALVCGAGSPRDVALSSEADAAAAAQVAARIEAGSCAPPCPAPDDERDLEPPLERARAESPLAVAQVAAEHARQLPPAVLVELLHAEARGEVGLALLGDDAVRGWLGDQQWSDLAAAVMSAPGPVAAYAQLRLAPVLSDMPRAPGRAGERELDRWTEQALRVPDVASWRVYAAQGDVATAELALASRWRPPRAELGEDETLERVEHWSERMPIDTQTLRAALVAARLRKAAGKHDVALRLSRRALSVEDGIEAPRRSMLAQDAVLAAIGWGRPWHALALLDTGAVLDPTALRGAASTAIILARAMCGGACLEDEDLGVVTRVMGPAWVEDARAELLGWSLSRRTRPEPSGACPTVAELVEPDAAGPLADALRAAREDLEGPGVGGALAAALASDLRSWCAAAIVLPAMVEGQHALPAERLSDSLSHAPESKAVADLSTHAKLAVVAGQHDRARLLAVAAAGESATPRDVWIDLAGFAATAGSRQLELQALREALMHSRGVRDRRLELRLLLVALGDVAVSWGQDLEQGKEATRGHVLDYLDPVPRSQRWHAERDLLTAVREQEIAEGWDAQARVLLIDALGGPDRLSNRHPRALDRLRGEEPGPSASPLHDEGIADDVRAGRVTSVPALASALADPRAFESTRVALASTARDWSARRRMAISLLVLGGPRVRHAAWTSLSEMSTASETTQRRALIDIVVQRPAGLDPTWGRWGPARPTVVLEGRENLVRVVLGLDLEPPVVAP